MAYQFHVTIEGAKQGKFKGDKITGLGFSYEVQSPRDQATGQASGKRQHKPIVLTKEWGASTPQIFQALVTNEVLKSVLFEFFHTTTEGVEEVYHTVKLTNATISELRQRSGAVPQDDQKDLRNVEDVSFTFAKIEIENKPGKTAASDDWLVPR
jgi:type VI secretion system secreted protein Hcp